MSTVYLSTAYLAPVAYYKALCHYDRTVIEACSHYVKQSYRNRCTIMSAGGELSLSIPVERTCPGKPLRAICAFRHTIIGNISIGMPLRRLTVRLLSSSITAMISLLFMRNPNRDGFFSIITTICRKWCAGCWVSHPIFHIVRTISLRQTVLPI